MKFILYEWINLVLWPGHYKLELNITIQYCLRSPVVSLSHYVPTFVSCLGSLAGLLSYCMPASDAFTAFFLPCFTLIFCCGIQLFYCHFLCLINLLLLDLHLLKHSNNLCQINFGPMCKLTLENSFVRSQISAHMIETITMTCRIRLISTNSSWVLILHSSTLVCWLAIMIKKSWTWVSQARNTLM